LTGPGLPMSRQERGLHKSRDFPGSPGQQNYACARSTRPSFLATRSRVGVLAHHLSRVANGGRVRPPYIDQPIVKKRRPHLRKIFSRSAYRQTIEAER
jgi:hypothetical protein